MIPGSGRSVGKGTGYPLPYSWASLGAQLVKNLPAIRETWVQSLGWEDPGEGKGDVNISSELYMNIYDLYKPTSNCTFTIPYRIKLKLIFGKT